jgi:hypothetical protein
MSLRKTSVAPTILVQQTFSVLSAAVYFFPFFFAACLTQN